MGPNIAGMKEELWPDQSLEGLPVGQDDRMTCFHESAWREGFGLKFWHYVHKLGDPEQVTYSLRVSVLLCKTVGIKAHLSGLWLSERINYRRDVWKTPGAQRLFETLSDSLLLCSKLRNHQQVGSLEEASSVRLGGGPENLRVRP